MNETYHTHLIQHDKALDFITAGKATFTLKSTKTGGWFTYKAEVVERFGKKKVIVRLLNGSDNVSNYTYLCTLLLDSDGIPEVLREKSKISDKAQSFIFFDLALTKLLLKIPTPQLEIWHEGRCCRCGRKLTVPESIESGIGPECSSRVKNFEI